MAAEKKPVEEESSDKAVRRSTYKLDGQDELKIKLLTIKMSDQLSWNQLADEVYPELTDGDTINWKTLRSTFIRESSMTILPEKVSGQVQAAVTALWDKVDMVQIIIYVLQARLTEWSMYYDRLVVSMIDETSVVKFSNTDRDRMDFLTNEIFSFFFRATGIMRDLELQEVAKALTRSISAVAVPDDLPIDVESVDIKLIMETVTQRTRAMMESVNTKHRLEGRGHYRELPEVDEDSDDNS